MVCLVLNGFIVGYFPETTRLRSATTECEEQTLRKGFNYYVVWEERSVTSQITGIDMVYEKIK